METQIFQWHIEYLFAILLFVCTIGTLFLGFPVAFTLGGMALLFALMGAYSYTLDIGILGAIPSRIYGILTQENLVAIPLFIFMGLLLEKSGISEELLENMTKLLGSWRPGLGVSVIFVGMMLAASTGIVGATIIAMGLISLPCMLKNKYEPSLASGIVLASGSLGQIIPPSIVLIILGDQISSAHQEALNMDTSGVLQSSAVSVGDLFIGAIIQGLLLVLAYMLYVICISMVRPDTIGPQEKYEKISFLVLIRPLIFPLLLMTSVLGSILLGIASSTEAASIGATVTFIFILITKRMVLRQFKETLLNTISISSMIYMILIGASFFSLVFRGFLGDEMVYQVLHNLPGGKWTALFCVMLLIFVLGFFLDFFEITFIIVPIIVPSLILFGFHPIWLGIMIALNLQTSFLTPPLGFSLFYLRGVAPPSISTETIYKGAVPFIIIQICVLCLVGAFPQLVTFLGDF